MKSPRTIPAYISLKTFVLNDEGKILIIRRSKTAPSRTLGWDLVGGALEFGEDPTEGALREIKEETGLDVDRIKPFDLVSFPDEKNYVVMIAFWAKTTGEEIVLSFEHDDHKWITKEEFISLNIDPVFNRFANNLE